MEEALSLYKQGLEEKDTFLRNKAFNTSIERILESKAENDALMAANLVQLRQYPLAVYYYMKELKKDPSNQDIRHSLDETIKIGGLPSKVPPPASFGPSSWVLGLVFLLWFLSFSLWLKVRKRKLLLISFIPLLVFIVLGVLSYRSPIEAVIIHAQILYQSSLGKETVSPTPIPAGLIVTVLDVQEKGRWIKIRTEDGVMGYVPQDSIRVVD